jgi:small nuclear ribonucleoprotein E
MNTVLDEAEEIYLKKGNRKKLGRIILKGDSISLICNVR